MNREFGPADHHPAEYDARTDWLHERPDADHPTPTTTATEEGDE